MSKEYDDDQKRKERIMKMNLSELNDLLSDTQKDLNRVAWTQHYARIAMDNRIRDQIIRDKDLEGKWTLVVDRNDMITLVNRGNMEIGKRIIKKYPLADYSGKLALIGEQYDDKMKLMLIIDRDTGSLGITPMNGMTYVQLEHFCKKNNMTVDAQEAGDRALDLRCKADNLMQIHDAFSV
jgi:hypothetical protein